jgi:hypothetical protein
MALNRLQFKIKALMWRVGGTPQAAGGRGKHPVKNAMKKYLKKPQAPGGGGGTATARPSPKKYNKYKSLLQARVRPTVTLPDTLNARGFVQ